MELTKAELKRMYKESTNKELCIKLGVTETTLLRHLKKAGIELKGKGNKKPSSPKLIIKG